MKKRGLLLFLFCVLPLSGCAGGSRGREPENTVMAQVVGVDRVGGTWFLTAEGKAAGGERVLQKARGSSLAEAFDGLSGGGDRWLSVTGVSDFLLGDGVEPREVLLFVLDNSGMSWRADVWHVPIAAAVMEECESIGDRLTVLKEGGTETVSVLDALVGLEEEGRTSLPALTARDGNMMGVGTIWYERSGVGA